MDLVKVFKLFFENSRRGWILFLEMIKLFRYYFWFRMDYEKL